MRRKSSQIKIHVKVGTAEFSAEGPRDLVDRQYQQFLEALPKAEVQAEPKPATRPKLRFKHLLDRRATVDKAGRLTLHFASPIDRGVLNAVYASTSARELRLKVRHAEPGGSILLLLYGFRVRRGDAAVLGGDLLAAAQASDINIDRVDRVLEEFATRHHPDAQLVRSSGERRGKRYSLTPAGVLFVEQILERIGNSMAPETMRRKE